MSQKLKPTPTERPEGVSPMWYIVLGLSILAVVFSALSLATGG
jgi:hypothetical protein